MIAEAGRHREQKYGITCPSPPAAACLIRCQPAGLPSGLGRPGFISSAQLARMSGKIAFANQKTAKERRLAGVGLDAKINMSIVFFFFASFDLTEA